VTNGTTYVGLDVHAQTIQVTMLRPDGERVEWREANEPSAVRRLAKKLLRSAPGNIHACYEAGPTGYSLQRRLQEAGVLCDVIAPSLIPRKPGERIKTDRRDARKLAELLRAGLLTVVHPPTLEDEAVRDLTRCREDARDDLKRHRNRLSKFLLRRDLRWAETKAWTKKFRTWLASLHFHGMASQATFTSYLLAVEQAEQRLQGLEKRLEELAQTEAYRERVGWLCCLRGFKVITAMTVLAELHEFKRFRHPRELMAYLGLVPSEHSSGGSERRGSITKTGNSHVRRLLVEAAWHSRHQPRVTAALRKRREGRPAWVQAIAERALHRLHRRYTRLGARGKEANKVVVAVARELVGFVWAILQGPTPAKA